MSWLIFSYCSLSCLLINTNFCVLLSKALKATSSHSSNYWARYLIFTLSSSRNCRGGIVCFSGARISMALELSVLFSSVKSSKISVLTGRPLFSLRSTSTASLASTGNSCYSKVLSKLEMGLNTWFAR